MRTSLLSPIRLAAMLALLSALAACTKGGQFDPTVLLDNDMFDSKKPLQGQREPVFPSGVPGATTGIPADLYKGYQPPPEQAANTGGAATPILPATEEPPKAEAQLKPKPKPAERKPKPKVVRTAPPRTEISVGLGKHARPPAQEQAQPSQSVWPAPPSTAQAQPSQSVWPAAPSTGGAQPAGQPSQSIWPNPSATGGTSQ
jgi:hypothetical protein